MKRKKPITTNLKQLPKPLSKCIHDIQTVIKSHKIFQIWADNEMVAVKKVNKFTGELQRNSVLLKFNIITETYYFNSQKKYM